MVLVENWTKWRLFVNDSTPTEEPPRVVFGNSAAKLPLQDSVNLCYFPNFIFLREFSVGNDEDEQTKESCKMGGHVKKKRPRYPARTRKGCLQLVLILNMLLATGECAFLVFVAWLGNNFSFRATGITMAALQCLELVVVLYIYGATLYKLTFSARHHCVFAAKLVFFPLVHLLNFLGLVALVFKLRQDAEAEAMNGKTATPVADRPGSTLDRKEYLLAGGVGYALFLSYSVPAWCLLYGEYERRFRRKEFLVAAGGGEEARRTRRGREKERRKGRRKSIPRMIKTGVAGARERLDSSREREMAGTTEFD